MLKGGVLPIYLHVIIRSDTLIFKVNIRQTVFTTAIIALLLGQKRDCTNKFLRIKDHSTVDG